MNRAIRFAIAVLIVAAWTWGAAYSEQSEATCGGDWDCEQQCLEQLQPDEDPDVCEVTL